ncbi:MAG: sulfotransferase family protein [Nostocaceae cyanobacterium]|nr:sulfotransferase family protein [Nostocaceae cyanobacterium]
MKNQSIQQPVTKSKIVALWSAPRCVSSAFLKAFSQRSQTAIVNEPFLDVYYFSKWRRSNRFGDCEEQHNYGTAQVIDSIQSPTTPLVFMKEIAYQALPYIDRDFLSNTINTFIVRDPREAIASWYRVPEYPTEEEFGFEALKQTWEIVTKELKQEPIVVEATDFRRNPEQVLSRYCQRIGVTFDPQMLKWDNGSLKQNQWKPHELESRAKWYKTLENSTGILPPTKVEVEILSQDIDMVERAMKIYERLSHFAL